jgi:hypothetical protein
MNAGGAQLLSQAVSVPGALCEQRDFVIRFTPPPRRLADPSHMSGLCPRIVLGLFAWLLLALPAAASQRSYLVRWIVPEGPVSGYVLSMGQAPGAYVYQEQIPYGPPDSQGVDSYLLEGLADDVDYYIAMIAWNEAGDSPLSNEIVIRALHPPISDFTGDSLQDVLVRHTSGSWLLYALDGAGGVSSSGGLGLTTNPDWVPISTEDFDGDGVRDVLIRHSGGAWYLYYLNPDRTVRTGNWLTLTSSTEWQPVSTKDFTGDGAPDVMIRHADGSWVLYELDASQNVAAVHWPRLTTSLEWGVLATEDVNADGFADILLRHTGGAWVTYLTDGTGGAQSVIWPGFTPSSSWEFVALEDFDGDATPDVLLRNNTYGHWYVYHLDAAMNVTSSGYLPLTSSLSWSPVSVEDFDGDGDADVLVRHVGGDWNLYALDGALGVASSRFVAMTGNLDWIPVSGNVGP